jgi:hypothetical protein
LNHAEIGVQLSQAKLLLSAANHRTGKVRAAAETGGLTPTAEG